LVALLPPAFLILAVLGSILAGIATPTESAAVGALGAMALAGLRNRLRLEVLRQVMRTTTQISSMVFLILLGASVFSLVFRGLGGDRMVEDALHDLPGGPFGAMLAVMALMFVLGFFLDFIEIVFVVVPIVGPVLLAMDLDPIWLGVMMAVNLQTSFLTPPFGLALFYLRGVAPASVSTADIYRGIVPFVLIQLLGLALLALFPGLATWLPTVIFG
jgi:tripartite ATP-independent transporter DctM subunit